MDTGLSSSSRRARAVRLGAARWWPGGALLLALCLAVYVPGLAALPPVDRDECRFAQASRQMFESAALPAADLDLRRGDDGRPIGAHAGGLAIPMVQDRPRLNKPPLVYWLQVASAWVFTGGDPGRDAIWMYRLPSALAALLSVLITWRMGLRMFDARAAWLGAAFLAVAPMVVWDAHQARADQLLLTCTTACMACLWSVWRCGGLFAAAGFWLFLGAGIMTKGFITPLVVISAIATLAACGRLEGVRRLRPALGVIILAACVAPWLWLVSREFGLGKYLGMVWDETFVRAAAGSREGHFAPPGMHLVLLGVLLWPGSLGALAAFGRTLRVGLPRRIGARWWRRVPGRPAELFLAAWIVVPWLVFEASLAKLPHYTMPLYPAVALLCARAALAPAFAKSATGLARAGVAVWAAVGNAAAHFAWAAGLFVLLPLAQHSLSDVPSTALPALGAGVAGAVLMTILTRSAALGRLHRALVMAVPAAALSLAAVMELVAPPLVPGSLTAEIMRTVQTVEGWKHRPICSTYHEDSVVFQTRGRVTRIAEAQIGEFLAAHPTAILIHRAPDAGQSVLPAGARVITVLGPAARRPVLIAVGPGAP